jgi:hypothetical protein
MLKSLIAAAGVALLPTAALAAGDIPARYKGEFSRAATGQSITGTFTGKRMAPRHGRTAGERASRGKAQADVPDRAWICPLGGLLAP